MPKILQMLQAGRVSQNFMRYEFMCPCGCGRSGADVMLLPILEEVRAWAGDIVHISSGFRCETHNASIPGASKRSFHIEAKAADIKVAGRRPIQVYRFLNERYPQNLGLGIYDTFTHVDVRYGRGRWDYRTKKAA